MTVAAGAVRQLGQLLRLGIGGWVRVAAGGGAVARLGLGMGGLVRVTAGNILSDYAIIFRLTTSA